MKRIATFLMLLCTICLGAQAYVNPGSYAIKVYGTNKYLSPTDWSVKGNDKVTFTTSERPTWDVLAGATDNTNAISVPGSLQTLNPYHYGDSGVTTVGCWMDANATTRGNSGDAEWLIQPVEGEAGAYTIKHRKHNCYLSYDERQSNYILMTVTDVNYATYFEFEDLSVSDTPLLTIGCVSDVHCMNNMITPSSGNLEDITVRSSLTTVLNRMKTEDNPDVLVFGGDSESDKTIAEENSNKVRQVLAEAMRSVFQEGKNPNVLWLTGNHDYEVANFDKLPKPYNAGNFYDFPMRQDIGQLSDDDKFYETVQNGENTETLLAAYHYVLNGFDFVVLNCGKYFFEYAWNYTFSTESATWVQNKLQEIDPDGTKTVFFLCHVPFPDSNSLNSGKGMKEVEGYPILKAACAAHPNLVMLFGHDHGQNTAYIREKTSQRVTLYDTNGNVVTTTDANHVDGTTQGEANDGVLKTSGSFYVTNNGQHLIKDDYNLNVGNTATTHTLSAGTAANTFRLSTSPEKYLHIGGSGRWSDGDASNFMLFDAAGQRVNGVVSGQPYYIVAYYSSNSTYYAMKAEVLGAGSSSNQRMATVAVTLNSDQSAMSSTPGAEYQWTFTDTAESSDSSFFSSFMGSLRYYYNAFDAADPADMPTVVQALVVKVYGDRVELHMKNYAQTGDNLNGTGINIAETPTPYTSFRTVTHSDPVEYEKYVEDEPQEEEEVKGDIFAIRCDNNGTAWVASDLTVKNSGDKYGLFILKESGTPEYYKIYEVRSKSYVKDLGTYSKGTDRTALVANEADATLWWVRTNAEGKYLISPQGDTSLQWNYYRGFDSNASNTVGYYNNESDGGSQWTFVRAPFIGDAATTLEDGKVYVPMCVGHSSYLEDQQGTNDKRLYLTSDSNFATNYTGNKLLSFMWKAHASEDKWKFENLCSGRYIGNTNSRGSQNNAVEANASNVGAFTAALISGQTDQWSVKNDTYYWDGNGNSGASSGTFTYWTAASGTISAGSNGAYKFYEVEGLDESKLADVSFGYKVTNEDDFYFEVKQRKQLVGYPAVNTIALGANVPYYNDVTATAAEIMVEAEGTKVYATCTSNLPFVPEKHYSVKFRTGTRTAYLYWDGSNVKTRDTSVLPFTNATTWYFRRIENSPSFTIHNVAKGENFGIYSAPRSSGAAAVSMTENPSAYYPTSNSTREGGFQMMLEGYVNQLGDHSGGNLALWASSSTNDDGSCIVLSSNDVSPEDVAELQSSISSLYEKKDMIGYPADMSSLEAYAQEGGVTASNYNAAETAYDAVYSSTTVNLPVVGKTYRVAFRKSDDTKKYIMGTGFTDDKENATLLIMKESGDESFPYYFETYGASTRLTNRGVQAVTTNSNSFMSVGAMTGSYTYVTQPMGKRVGTLWLTSKTRQSGGNGNGNLLIRESTNAYDTSNAPYMNGTYTSALEFEEYDPSNIYFSESLDNATWLRIANAQHTGYSMTSKGAGNVNGTATTDASLATQLYAFVGNNTDGFYIYNKELGADYRLTATGTTDGTSATWTTGEAAKWHLDDQYVGAASNPGFVITTQTGTSTKGLNIWAGAGGDTKFWNASGPGSHWTISTVDTEPTIIHYVVSGEKKYNDANQWLGRLKIQKGSFSSTSYVEASAHSTTFNAYLPKSNEAVSITNDVPLHGWNFEVTEANGEYTVTYTADQETEYQYLAFDKSAQWYRIPAIVSANNGDVVAVYDYRVCHSDVGYGEVDQVMRRSSDYGQTWTAETKIADGKGGGKVFGAAFGDPALVADRESGKMTLITVSGTTVYTQATATDHNLVSVQHSDDNGMTWSEPRNITDQFWGAEGAMLADAATEGESTTFAYSGFFGSGKILQSRKYKVGDYYRLYGALLCRGKNVSGAYVAYSDDMGDTWHLLGGNNAVKASPNSNEPKVEELPNGDIVLSGRKGSGRYFNVWHWTTEPTAENKAGEGSWGSEIDTNASSTPGGIKVGGNSCNGEILLVNVKKADDTDATLMLQSLPAGSDRSLVEIWYKDITDPATYTSSLEFASNWTRGLRVSDLVGSQGGSAYSTMCLQEDGRLGFFYEEGPATYCMVYVPLTIEKVTDGAYKGIVPELPSDEYIAAVGAMKNAYTEKNVELGSGWLDYTTADPEGLAADLEAVEPYMGKSAIGLYNQPVALTTIEDLTEALNSHAIVLNYRKGCFVRLQGYSGNYVAMPTTGTNAQMSSTEDKTTILYLSPEGQLISYGTGYGLQETSIVAPVGNTLSKYTVQASGRDGKFYITSNASGIGTYLYDNTANGTKLDRNTVPVTSGSYQTDWTITEVTEIPVTIGSVKYNTFCSPVATVVPEGVSAFVCRIDGDVIKLYNVVEVESERIIPAHTGVLLYAPDQQGDFTFQSTSYAENYGDANGFYGTLGTENYDGDYKWYSLQRKTENNTVGFFVKSSGTLSGFHAYIREEGSAPTRSFSFQMGDGLTVGVEEAQMIEYLNAPAYDLMGRRVDSANFHGLYIKGGQKLIQK